MPRFSTIQNSFTSGELSPAMHGRSDHAKYQSGLEECTNFHIIPQGGITRRPGFQFVVSARLRDTPCRLIPFSFSTRQSYVIEIGDHYMRFFKDGGLIVDPVTAEPYEIETPWSSREIAALTFAQSADVVYFAHPDHPVTKMARYDHTDWRMEQVLFRNGPFRDLNITDTRIKADGVSGTVTLTATDPIFMHGHVGALFKLDEEDGSAHEQWDVNINVSTIAEVGEGAATRARSDGNVYIAVEGTETGRITPSHIKGEEWDGPASGDHVLWRYLHSGYGVVRITAVEPGGMSATAEVQQITRGIDAVLPQSVTQGDGTRSWSEGAWSPIYGYPRAVAFFEQRLVFAGSLTSPQTVWASQINDFENFAAGSLDTDAYIYTLSAGSGGSRTVNAILHLSSGRSLIAHTTNGETVVGPSELGGVVTPTNVNARDQTDVGSGSTAPVTVDSLVLNVSRSGRRVHEIVFSFEQDRYVAPDLTLLSEHITKPETQ